MKIFWIIASLWFVAVVLSRETGNEIQSLDYEPDIEPYESLVPTERPIFKYQKNGIKLNLKIVSSVNDSVVEHDFPNFPTKDVGFCILDLSLTCVQRRVHQFLDKIRSLKEITLFGNWIKLVRAKEPAQYVTERRSLDSKDGMTDIINQDIDSLFDDFVLRINLPSIQGTKKNQIDLMFDETGLVEGRGKSGKGGKGGGGKCKKMIMMMMMGMMSMTAMKGMMMAGMSLMISKWMLIQKLMDSKKGGGGGGGGAGPWQSGGGGGGGAPLKEIILVTKGGGGGGGGGGGCCGGGGGGGPPMDSYGAPPPSSSYGAPSGGYDSSGGGWGRSFDTYVSPSNIISKIMLRPGIKAQDIADSPLSTESTRRIGAVAPVYETISSVHDEANNTSSNLTESKMPHKLTKNTTEAGNGISTPVQSRFVTLRSSYQIVPVKETRNVPAQNTVENPIYVNDWQNFELMKRWRTTQHSSVRPDQEAERSGHDTDSDRIKYNFMKSQQPYGRLIDERDIVFHGV